MGELKKVVYLSTAEQRSGSTGASGSPQEGRLHADPGGAVVSAMQPAVPRTQNVAGAFAQRREYGLLPALHAPHFSHHVLQLSAQPHSLRHHVAKVGDYNMCVPISLCFASLHAHKSNRFQQDRSRPPFAPCLFSLSLSCRSSILWHTGMINSSLLTFLGRFLGETMFVTFKSDVTKRRAASPRGFCVLYRLTKRSHNRFCVASWCTLKLQ